MESVANMAKRFFALVISFLFVLSVLPSNTTAQAAGNPFSAQDDERANSIQQSSMKGQPQKPTKEKKNRQKPQTNTKAIKDVYNVKFKNSASLTSIYNCVSKYPYQLLGASNSRLFKITLNDLKSFKKSYSNILDSISGDAEMKLYAAPNDQYFSEQWELPDINIPQAWDITKGSPDIKVAVIDTGFDRTHEDFSNSQILNGCDVTDSNMPVVDDVIGHGTEVASVIAAETNNGKGISGAGWNVSVIPYKVADEYGDIYASSVISAITMAADAGCDVISMSLGSYYYDNSLQSAINYANSKGCIVIAAAGNEGGSGNPQAGQLSYPASCTGVVSVASVGRGNNRSCFSQYNSMVDVAAPGENVLVADPYSITGYTVSSGTSFSTPYVASVAALAKSMNSSINGNDFQNLIAESSTDLGAPLRDNYYGWGLLNAGALLNAEKNPIVSGVNDHYIYNTSKTITFNRGTATLNGNAFTNGGTVSANGTYVLAVTDNSGNCTVVHFTIDKTAPVVSGVVNWGNYNTDRVITFNDGAATLNGQAFSSGDTVSDEGSYNLVATDSAMNSTSVQFTIDKTPPVISGVEDGAAYHSSVKFSYNEGSATLNGNSVSANTVVSNAGSYTLAVTDAAGNSSSVGFTISDLPSITSVQLSSALSKWVVDGGSGEIYALSGSNLLFINPDTLQVDSTLALPAAPTDLIADSGKLYIALDSVSNILVVDIASRSTDKTLTTANDPYRIVKDGENLFYTQYNQWCEIHQYNLDTNTDTNIGSPQNNPIYQPALAVNPALHILYIGESGLSSTKLYYYDENQKAFTISNYNGGNSSRSIYFDGTYVYYAGRMFQPDNPKKYSSSFLGFAGVLNVINGCIITGSGTVFDRDTSLQIGSFNSNIGLAAVADNGLIYFNGSTEALNRATCSSSIGTDTIVGLLGGTSMAPEPKPGDPIQVNASTQKTLINSSLCGWVQDDASHMLYAISASSKALYFINEQTMNVDTILALNEKPTDIQLSGGKIYVALDDAHKIDIIDPAAKTIEKTIQTAEDPYQIAIDGNNLFYTQSSQWCSVHKYDLVNNTDSVIPWVYGSFYCPDIAVNTSLHILYIGESGSTGSGLYYYDETLKTFSKKSEFYLPSRSISFDGKYVYYANHAFDPGAPKIVGDLSGAGAFLVTNGSVIASTASSGNSFYDADTCAEIGTTAKNFPLLAIGGDKIFTYSGADYSVTANQSATGSVDSGNIVPLLHGTQLPMLKPTPGQQIDPATYSLAMAAPLSNWILDEATHTLMAISAAQKALLFINSDTMDLEKVIYLKSQPTDMIAEDGKLYVALDVCNRIDVYDIQNRVFVSSVETASDPNHIVKDGDNIFYSTYGSAQWQDVREYNLTSSSDKTIISSVYNVTLADNTQDHILYVGETGISSSYLTYYDTNAGKQLGKSDDVGYGSGKTLYDGEYVYYSGGVYEGKTPTLIEDDGVNFIYAKNGMAFSTDFVLIVGLPDLMPLPISADLAALSDDFSLFLYSRSGNIVMKYDSSGSGLLDSKISGVQDGGSYPDQATVTFNSGTAFLDNQPFASGTTVNAHGEHRLLYFDNDCNGESLSFYILKSVQSISLNQTELNLDIDGKVNLTAEVLPADADNQSVAWSSSNNSIATVNSSGRVVGKGEGDCVITALVEDDEKTATCQVHVSSKVLPPVAVQSVTLNKKTVQMNIWDMEQLSATINPTDADNIDATWSSSNEDVVDVDNDGYVYAVAPGTATVMVTTEDGHFTDSCTITVVQPVYSILLSKHTDRIATGLTDQPPVFFAPSDATNKELTWSSSDNSVATVDQNGLFSATGPGLATITATSQENAAISDSCQITVISATLRGISLKSGPVKTAYIEGQSIDLTGATLTLAYSDGTSQDIQVTSAMLSGFDSSLGTKTVAVRYGGFSTSFQVTFSAKLLTGISVKSGPAKATYLQGESLDLAGATITLAYNDGTSNVIPVTSGMVSGYTSTPGVKTIIVSYGRFTTSFNVTVISASLTGISLKSSPTKTVYLQGENLDLTGAAITRTFNNGTSDVIPVTTSMVSGYTSTPGIKTITVSYGGFTTSFTVSVIKTYTVTFNFNYANAAAKTATAEYGSKIAPPGTSPYRPGLKIEGWYREQACTNKWLFDTDVVSGDITLYARWVNVTHTVTFDSQGGSAVAPLTGVTYNSLIPAPLIPAREHYTFKGWYREASCKNAWVFSKNRTPDGDITLYVKWAAGTFAISFNSQGGSKVTGKTAGYDTLITAPKSPTRKGYTFSGWYKEAGCVNAWTFSSDTVTATTTLYARWAPHTCIVTYNAAGGLIGENPSSTVSADYGTTLTVPETPARDGYVFGGWYTSTKYAAQWNFASGRVTGSFTLYARWIKNGYAVAFNTMGGTPAPATQYVPWNSLAADPGALTKAGYFLDGWYTSSTKFTSAYKWDFAARAVTGSVTLYARWLNALSTPSITAVATAPDTVVVTCSAVPYATNYVVDYFTATTGLCVAQLDSADRVFTITGLSADTVYYFNATAYRVESTNVYRGGVTGRIAETPGTPAFPSAAAASYNTISVTWTAADRLTGYEVWRATSAGGKYALLTVTSLSSYTNTVNTGATYWYKVRAYRMNGKTRIYSAFSAAVSARCVLAGITNPATVTASATSVTVSWDAVPGAMKYEVWYAPADTGVYKLLTTTTLTGYTQTKLVTGQPYYYKVRAYRLVGTMKVYGNFTSVMIATPAS